MVNPIPDFPNEPWRTWLGFAVTVLSLWLFALPADAAIQAGLDRNPVDLGESFTLTLEADENPDDDPDFSPLEEDFDILDQSHGSQFSFSNGRSTASVTWTLQLMPKRAGTLAIPAIAFGTERSNPLSIAVKSRAGAGNNAGGGEGIAIEVTAEPKQPYVQAQVLYTVKVLGRLPFGGNLSEPEVDNALVEKLGDDRRYTTTRDGVPYTVIERRYALFAQKSGPLRVAPLRLDAQLAGGSTSPFGGFFGRGTRTTRLTSESVELEVRPIPQQLAGKAWLPAEAVELDDSWAQGTPQITTGEPVTRTLTLRAKGATVGLLPELARAPAGGPDLKQYPDQPVLHEDKQADGMNSSRQEKTAFIIGQPGTYRLPAIEIPWWNTRNDKAEVALIPERIVTVLPSAQYRPAEPLPVPAAPEPPGKTESAPAVPAPGMAIGQGGGSDPWFWVAMALGLGWLATALAWARSVRRRPDVPAEKAESPGHRSPRALASELERACRDHDGAAARQALAAWVEQQRPAGAANLGEFRRHCGDARLAAEIDRLNQTLYGRGVAEGWRGDGLWTAFSGYSAPKSGQKEKAAAQLEPLHRLSS